MASDPRTPPEPPDLHIGRKAVELGLITATQLADVLLQMSQSVATGPLRVGQTLVTRGLLTQQQIGVLSDLAKGAPPKQVGKYHILRELGQGGMGVVYEAQDPELGRRVALKMLLLNFNPEPSELALEEERFVREARLSANLPKHPHIVGVYEAGVADGHRFIAMEYIEGRQFSDWRQQKPLRQQIAVLRDVALAADHAHRHGVIHRDLKPANILVDGANQPHVTDFGLAKRGQSEGSLALTASGAVMGTPAYMSPEQAEGKKEFDLRVDVWALGVMLFEILTGRVPFEAESPLKMIMKTAQEEVPTPTSLLRGAARTAVDRTIESICMKALSKSPRARHASAREFADDLTRWIKGVKPAPVTTRQTAPSKFPLWAGIAAGVVVAAIVAAVALSSSSDRAGEYVTQGRLLLNQGKYEDAHIKFGQALEVDPGNRSAAEGKKEAHEKMLAGAARKAAVPPAPTPNPAPAPGPGPSPAPAPPPSEDAARKAREAAAAKERETFSKELVELDAQIASFRESESFGQARDLVTQTSKRHEAAEWKDAAAARLEELRKSVDALYAKVKAEAADSKRRGEKAALDAGVDRVAQWKWPGLSKDLEETLAGIPAPPAPAPPPSDPGPLSLPELAPLKGHENAIGSIAISPDGKSVLTCAFDKSTRLWDLERRELRKKLGSGAEARSVAISPDGRWLASGLGNGEVKLWDSAKLQQRVLAGHGGQVIGATFTPDSKILVTASVDGTARLWDPVTGTQKSQLGGHPAGALSASVSSNGRLLATGSADSQVKVWELPGGRELKRFDVGGGATSISTLFLPDGKSVLSAGNRGTITLWDVDSGRSRLLGSHAKEIRGMALSPDGRWVASAAGDGLKIWETATGALRMTMTDESGFFSIAFSPKGDLLAGGSGGFTLRLWDASALSKK